MKVQKDLLLLESRIVPAMPDHKDRLELEILVVNVAQEVHVDAGAHPDRLPVAGRDGSLAPIVQSVAEDRVEDVVLRHR